jgi:2,3-bisphosphoglycerate-dependent phosphoglycerate mutase/probable phosphoglycerate mutase
MRSLLVVRHGETTWNVAGRWQGWIDVELAPAGEDQARARGEHLAGLGVRFERILSSDLQRAARTAELIAAAIDGPPVEPHPGLRERSGGRFEGLTGEEIDAGWPGFRDRWRAGLEDAPPDGESDATVWARVHTVLDDLGTEPGGPALLVTHGGVARILSDHAGVPTRAVVPNVGGRWYVWDGETLRAGADLDPLPDTDHTKSAME